jgi:hypothetical protein
LGIKTGGQDEDVYEKFIEIILWRYLWQAFEESLAHSL